MNLAALVAGPLVGPECLRAARRRWLVPLRTLAGLLLSVPAMMALWWWWMRAEVEPNFRGDRAIPTALEATIALSVLIAAVLAPAVLAGSLAGERERGSIGLLLSTRVDSREIVTGRLLGKLTPVFAMLLAGWPFAIFFGSLRDLGPAAMLGMLALPFAVALGAGGLAIALSSVAKRGWSALMTIYLVEVLLLLAPLLGLIPGWRSLAPALSLLNPGEAVGPAIATASAAPLLAAIATWLGIGLLGTAFAAWRIRPSFLASVDGKVLGRSRRRVLPPVDEARPMLWKERNIDRGAVLGRFGRTLGVLLFLFLAIGSLTLAGLAAYFAFVRPDGKALDRVTGLFEDIYCDPGPIYAGFLELAIGLRAAVAIASERERGTWEALLTSPLTGREIIGGKLRGSLRSLRWLAAATILAWVVGLALGAMSGWRFAFLVGQVAIVGTFSAAVGVRASLACGTATKAMTATVGAWLAALLGLSILALVSTLGLMLLGLMAWMVAGPLGLVAPGGRPWGFGGDGTFKAAWTIMMGAFYIGVTSTIIGESWTRFDAISGRMSGDDRDRTPPRPVFDDGTPLDGAKPAPAEDREPMTVAT